MSDTIIRVTPVQARGNARLESLRQAAREVYEEVGRDNLTTNMVAERAGASIGTVYRYFPDRVAIMDDIHPNRDLPAKVLDEVIAVMNDIKIENPRERLRQARKIVEESGVFGTPVAE